MNLLQACKLLQHNYPTSAFRCEVVRSSWYDWKPEYTIYTDTPEPKYLCAGTVREVVSKVTQHIEGVTKAELELKYE